MKQHMHLFIDAYGTNRLLEELQEVATSRFYSHPVVPHNDEGIKAKIEAHEFMNKIRRLRGKPEDTSTIGMVAAGQF